MLNLLLLSLPGALSKVPMTGFPQPRIVGGTQASASQLLFAAFGIVKGEDDTQSPPTTFLEACTGSLIVDYSASTCTSNANCNHDEACVAYIDGNSYCQATWVITAGHCLNHGFSDSPISGYNVPTWIFGNADRTAATDTTAACTEIFLHPQYDDTTQYYDVALCKLGGTSTSLVRAVLMSGDDSSYTTGGQVSVAGWGRTADNANLGVETILRYVTLHTSTNSACQSDLNTRLAQLGDDPYTLISAQLCAGGDTFGDSGKDSCQGDSGGPLFLQYSDGTPLLLGTTSQGWGCAAGPAGVYTRVSSIVNWVVSSQTCSRSYKQTGVCSPSCTFLNQTGGYITCGVSTSAPTTKSPTVVTRLPTTAAPSTITPTRTPTTSPTVAPTTKTPTTQAPSTTGPTAPPTATLAPTTVGPTTTRPSFAPSTTSPTTNTPTTEAPSTTRPSFSPTTPRPSFSPTTPPTDQPTTLSPTNRPTASPTTFSPTTTPTTKAPLRVPTTRAPTGRPTTKTPTARPTTKVPTRRPTFPPTNAPTTRSPTAKPTTRSPTARPTTRSPTARPTTRSPTARPTTRSPL